MNRKWKQLLPLFALVVALSLSACGGSAVEEAATATPEVTEPEPTPEPTAEPTPEPTAEPTPEPLAEPAVTVEDQALGEGDTVAVPLVTAAEDGWLVIHADADGAPGPVLGQTAITAGDNEDVAVEIDAEAATATLYAMLHVDAGESGTYEFPGPDGPVQDSAGNVVVRPFAVEGLATAETEETEDEDVGDLYGGPSSGTGEEDPEGDATGDQDGAQVAVSALDLVFEPAQMTVAVGTTVVWTNNGDLPHTVTADNGAFDSGTLDSGATFEFTFDSPGEYAYYCAFHGGPGGVGMAGTIIVEE